MVDLRVLEERLYISKGPGITSWTIVLGLFILGIYVAGNYADSILTQLMCLLLCLMTGLSCLEEWEDCIFDQYENEVKLIRSKWYQRLLGIERNTKKRQLSNITAIWTTKQRVLMGFKSGTLLPVTETSLNKTDRKAVSTQVASFLHLNHIEEVSADILIGSLVTTDAQESLDTEDVPEESPQIPRMREQIKILLEPVPPT